jgi:PTS system mannose-specific IIA component
MRRTLLLTHGGMAKGVLNTLELFIGERKDYKAISAYVDECDPKTELEKFWTEVKDEDQVFIFTDIMGGSVNQLVVPKLARPNTYLFSGMNLPMLIQASCLPEDASVEDIKALVNVGKDGVVCMNDYKFESFSEDDE